MPGWGAGGSPLGAVPRAAGEEAGPLPALGAWFQASRWSLCSWVLEPG